jgi:hypothetical protein
VRLWLTGTAVLCLALASVASALTISRFSAYATAANIHWAVTYCEASPSRLHDHLVFFALDRRSGRFTGDGYVTDSRAGCYRLSNYFPNRYLGGLWELDLTLDDSHGVLLRRSARVFISGP